MRTANSERWKRANSEWRIANSICKRRIRRSFYSLLATRYSPFSIRCSLFAFVLVVATPAFAIDCAPYCDFTHNYGPYDLSWKQPGRYAFPVCGPNGVCAPHAVNVHSPVSGWAWYWPYRGVRITVRPRTRRQ